MEAYTVQADHIYQFILLFTYVSMKKSSMADAVNFKDKIWCCKWYSHTLFNNDAETKEDHKNFWKKSQNPKIIQEYSFY